MQTTDKLSHLKAMGIEVWRDRSAEALEPFNFHYLQLQAPKPIVILADQDPSRNAEEEALLQAIAKALGFVVEVQGASSKDLASILSGDQELIVMGDILAERVSGKSFIRSYAPSELLKDPKLKAQTWQAIRHLKL